MTVFDNNNNLSGVEDHNEGDDSTTVQATTVPKPQSARKRVKARSKQVKPAADLPSAQLSMDYVGELGIDAGIETPMDVDEPRVEISSSMGKVSEANFTSSEEILNSHSVS